MIYNRNFDNLFNNNFIKYESGVGTRRRQSCQSVKLRNGFSPQEREDTVCRLKAFLRRPSWGYHPPSIRFIHNFR